MNTTQTDAVLAALLLLPIQTHQRLANRLYPCPDDSPEAIDAIEEARSLLDGSTHNPIQVVAVLDTPDPAPVIQALHIAAGILCSVYPPMRAELRPLQDALCGCRPGSEEPEMVTPTDELLTRAVQAARRLARDWSAPQTPRILLASAIQTARTPYLGLAFEALQDAEEMIEAAQEAQERAQ